MRGHVGAETLAAFREELLPRRKAARVAAHLAACPRCAAVGAQLAEVTALLTRSPAPPMPAGLTARIEAAIAAEAAARSAGSTAAAPAPSGTAPGGAPMASGAEVAFGADGASVGIDAGGTDAAAPGGRHAARGGRSRGGQPAGGRSWGGQSRGGQPSGGRSARGRPGTGGRPRLALRVATALAAVVVLAGGAFGVARLLSGGAAEPSAGSAAPFSGGQARAASPSLAAGARAAPSAVAPGPPVIHSGTRYQPGRLAAQVSAVLRRSRPGSSGRNTSPAFRSAGNSPAASAFSGLPGCLRHVAGRRHPLLVDVASYGGRPAAIIVLPGGQGGRLVLVVGTGCSATSRDLLATATLPRPR